MTGAGYLINMNDVAGPYAGIIFGISNTFGTIPGIKEIEWNLILIILILKKFQNDFRHRKPLCCWSANEKCKLFSKSIIYSI